MRIDPWVDSGLNKERLLLFYALLKVLGLWGFHVIDNRSTSPPKKDDKPEAVSKVEAAFCFWVQVFVEYFDKLKNYINLSWQQLNDAFPRIFRKEGDIVKRDISTPGVFSQLLSAIRTGE